jgi:hypothetical protein
VGVVTAKLNALKFMVATDGDIAQNVNFAIKSAVAANFLETNRVNFTHGSANVPMPSADQARATSVFIRSLLLDTVAVIMTAETAPRAQALTRAADRGVRVRIYLDGTQLGQRSSAKVFNDLAETPGVEIRIKHETSARCTSRATRLTGDCCAPAPQTFPLESAGAAACFKRNFEARFASGEALTIDGRYTFFSNGYR